MDVVLWDVKKAISAWILGFLWLGALKEVTTGNWETAEAWESGVANPEVVPSELKDNFYYFSGLNTLTYFAWNESDNSKETFEKIRDIKFQDLEDTDTSILNSDNAEIHDNFKKTKESLLWNDSRVLLSTSLSTQKMNAILEKNTTFFEGKIDAEHLGEIRDSVKQSTFSYEQLSFDEIGLMLFASTNTLGILGLEGGIEWIDDIKAFISEDSGIEIDKVKHELIWKRQGLISDSLFSRFVGLWNVRKMWGEAYMNEENLRWSSSMKDLSDAESVQLEKIISFKNWLLDWFLKNNKNLLVEKWYDEDFKNSLNYKWVILLYLTLGWEESLENMSAFDLPILYEVTGSIIEWWDRKWRGNGYKSEVVKYIAGKDEHNIFDEEEEESLEIIWAKLAVDWLEYSVNILKKKLWKTTILFNDNLAWSAGVTVAWLGMMKYLWKIIPQARLAWLAVSVVGMLSVLTDLYGKSSSLLEDMEWLFSWDKNEWEIDIIEYTQKIESFTDSIETREIEMNGKMETVWFYAWQKWLEVIHDGTIYKLDTGPSPLDIDIPSLSESVWDQLPSTPLNSASTDTYKWKKIDFSKVEFRGDDIIFWEDKNSVSLALIKITDALELWEIKHPRKLVAWEEYLDMEYLIVEKITNSEPTSEFFGLMAYIKEIFKEDLILVKIWDINKKTT